MHALDFIRFTAITHNARATMDALHKEMIFDGFWRAAKHARWLFIYASMHENPATVNALRMRLYFLRIPSPSRDALR